MSARLKALTKMNAIMNPTKKEINLCGQSLKGVDNSSGHFVLEMTTAFGTQKQEQEECVFQFNDETVQEKEREKLIIKIHVNIGHAPTHQMIKLLENVENVKDFNKKKPSHKEFKQ